MISRAGDCGRYGQIAEGKGTFAAAPAPAARADTAILTYFFPVHNRVFHFSTGKQGEDAAGGADRHGWEGRSSAPRGLGGDESGRGLSGAEERTGNAGRRSDGISQPLDRQASFVVI